MKNKSHSLWGDAWQRLRKNRMAMVCLGLVIFFTLLAIYGEGVYRYHEIKDITPAYQMADLDKMYQPPG
ncbi:MAG: hypothetical protein KAH99_01005, partial [Verrucomicrobia bacterium]|nr:hypothetical protein [Verrucomicrobiota bacterium]